MIFQFGCKYSLKSSFKSWIKVVSISKLDYISSWTIIRAMRWWKQCFQIIVIAPITSNLNDHKKHQEIIYLFIPFLGSGIVTRDELGSFYSSVLCLNTLEVGRILDASYQAMTSVSAWKIAGLVKSKIVFYNSPLQTMTICEYTRTISIQDIRNFLF